jgi:8-oxo-dGTP pyrophosphatase MutT (NUDIX family)
MEKDIHTIQANILKELLFKEQARFSELNVDKLPTDQFTFHIKRLQETGIIEKTAEGLYALTLAGKDYANRFDVDSGNIKVEKQAKISVIVVVIRERDGRKEYLMQRRLKQPFFGFRGFITGKIKIGESVFETAERELLEETGLEAILLHKTIYHELIFSNERELLEDKYFFLFVGTEPKGELKTDIQGGKNEWVTEKEVNEGDAFYDIGDLIQLANAKPALFSEKEYIVKGY